MSSIRCGNCKKRHSTADEVRGCYARTAEEARWAEAEIAAERAATRYFEEGPHGPRYDVHEERERYLEDLDRQRLEDARRAAGQYHEPEGYFTVVEDGDHVTLRFRRQDEQDDFMPGKVLVGYLTGPDNTWDYLNIGNLEAGRLRVWRKHRDKDRIIEAIKVVLGDPDAAREAYAVESGNCSRCGRTLTVPASLNRGLGPVCATKV